MNSQRADAIAGMVDLKTRIVQESGRPEGIDAAVWVAEWILRPVPALGNRRPIDLLDTAEGRQYVFDVIARMQSGAYS